MSTQKDIDNLCNLAHEFSDNINIVQGGGGNVSIKSDDGKLMFIKASGYPLSKMTKTDGFVSIDLEKASSFLSDADSDLLPDDPSDIDFNLSFNHTYGLNNNLSPSIETGFHTLLGKAVLHTHPISLIALSSISKSNSDIQRILQTPTIWIPYYPPGIDLALYLKKYLSDNFINPWSTNGTIILQNHGLITWGPDIQTVINSTIDVIRECDAYFCYNFFNSFSSTLKNKNHNSIAQSFLIQFYNKKQSPVEVFLKTPDFMMLELIDSVNPNYTFKPITPDDVVYGPDNVYNVEFTAPSQLSIDFINKLVTGKNMLIFKDFSCLLTAPDAGTLKVLDETIYANYLINNLSRTKGTPRYLISGEICYIRSMRNEIYRQKVAGNLNL